MEKRKLFTGILVFGSLWGFSEIIIGSMLRDARLPAGAILTGVFAFGLMLMSRILFKTRGMQMGMGLVAGALRLFMPFSDCTICSGIAIMAEGVIFEVLWHTLSRGFEENESLINKSSLGIVMSYGVYVTGYMITQILTPVVASAGFHLKDLLPFIPQILSSGLLAAALGGVMSPLAFSLKSVDVTRVKNRLYYPAAIGISALCWWVVIAKTY